MVRKKLKRVLQLLDNVSVIYPETAQNIENNKMEISSRENISWSGISFSCFSLSMIVAYVLGIKVWCLLVSDSKIFVIKSLVMIYSLRRGLSVLFGGSGWVYGLLCHALFFFLGSRLNEIFKFLWWSTQNMLI